MLIDYSKSYRIEPIPSKDQKELAEKGISVYPGTFLITTAKWDSNLLRFTQTGLDEYAPEILQMESEERKKAQESIIARRKALGAKLGDENYFSPTSSNWEDSNTCKVFIEVGEDLKVRVNNKNTNVLNPAMSYQDEVTLGLLMNDPDFPKSKQESKHPKFKDAKFYLTTDEEISSLNKETSRRRRRAYKYFDELFSEQSKSQKAFEVAYFLNFVGSGKVNMEELEDKMEKFIFKDPKEINIELFIKACEMPNDILMVHNLVKRAYEVGVIRNTGGGYFTRGTTTYRATLEETAEYLLQPGQELELAEIRNEVGKKTKKQNLLKAV